MLEHIYLFCADHDIIQIMKEENKCDADRATKRFMNPKRNNKGYAPLHMNKRSRHRGHNHGKK